MAGKCQACGSGSVRDGHCSECGSWDIETDDDPEDDRDPED